MRGWYRLDVTLAGRGDLDPKVLFDLDPVCGENCGVKLAAVSGGSFKALVFLPEMAASLHLFPHTSRADFRDPEVRLFRLDRASMLSSLANRFFRLVGCGRRRGPDCEIASLPQNPGSFCHLDFETGMLVFRPTSYRHWIARYDYSAADRKGIEKKIGGLREKPVISIVVPALDHSVKDLDETVRSLHRQVYQNWELLVAGAFPAGSDLGATLRRWCDKDRRIKMVSGAELAPAHTAVNRTLELASGKYATVIGCGGTLREHALAEVMLAISAHPKAEIVYCDEDKIAGDGHRLDPWFKCDWAPDLFLSQDYLGHLTVHRTDNIKRVGGWRDGFEGAENYDLTLRLIEDIPPQAIIHVAKVLYHERAPEPESAPKSDGKDAARKAVADHLQRTGVRASVDRDSPYCHVVYDVPDPSPAVSLIIPTRDNRTVLESCISSVLEKTTYDNYEILVVNNGSEEQGTIDYLATIARNEKITVLDFPGPFNFSAINNFAADRAGGALIALLNDDVEVISPRWLSLMAGHAMRPEIGCVGAKLYYPDERIQHAGVVLGMGGIAGHGHKYLARSEEGHFSRLMLTHNVSAVTAACMVVRAQTYDEVGGFNEKDLTIAFNDVDFCLKVRDRGYRNLFEPGAELYHHESISRGRENTRKKKRRFRAEVDYMKRRWGEALDADPYYSPHLTLSAEDFSLRR